MILWQANTILKTAEHHDLSPHFEVRLAAKGEWDDLLADFPDHTVFHTLPWLETVESVHGGRLQLLCADQDGECAAVWPVFGLRKGPLRVLGSPLPGWSTAYLGPLFKPTCEVPAVLDVMLRSGVLGRNSYFACKSLRHLGEHIDLTVFGFENVLNFETYCLDLTIGRDALWDKLKSECRTQIRKARKLGIEFTYERDDSFLDEYWEMSLETFALTNILPMFTKPFLKEMWRRMTEVDRVRGLSAWHKGERVAALILPFDHHTMYYWSGASYVRWRNLPANNLLHWEAIEEATRLGLRNYDFISTLGGAGRFKRTFGPSAVHSARHWERTSSRLVKALKHGYEHYMMLRMRAKG